MKAPLFALSLLLFPAGALAGNLPYFARQSPAPAESPWKGLRIGTELSVTSFNGGAGRVGGAAYAAYDKTFANNWIVSVRGSTGYVPAFTAFNSRGGGMVRGFDFAATDVTVGYRMGQLTPWVSAGFAGLRPSTGNFYGAGDSLNSVFNSPDNLATAQRLHAGFDYQINGNLSIGMSVGVQRGGGFAAWP